MTTATVQVVDKRIVCQNCSARYTKPGRDNISDESAARAIGWSVWSGKTLGGREEERIFCPLCAGRHELTDKAKAKATTWDAKCNTCDATATEEWHEDLPLSEDDAQAWKSEHRCEPWVELVKPKLAEAS